MYRGFESHRFLHLIKHMASNKKGILTITKEWAKHLRPFNKRVFWGKERRLEKKDINKRIKDGD
jgi:hypothetical protein